VARRPDLRAADLMAAFADPSIAGIVATIGGEDAIRLLPHVDLDVIAAHPKPLLGYSDTTVVHLACLAAGVRSYYGPSVLSGFAENGGAPPYLVDSVRRTLFEAEPIGPVEPNPAGWTTEHLDWGDPAKQAVRRRLQPPEGRRSLGGAGRARGRLLGGCAEVLDWLRGTAWFPPLEAFDGAVLFWETSEDAPEPAVVTRLLRSLASQGVLERLAAIALGRWGGLPDASRFAEWDAAVVRAVVEEGGLDRLPILAGLDFGHTDPICTLPYGALAEVDVDALTLTILEPGVR
jgi:muramoyltetrapeptide carboxypeptidase LdcA involved in peptidoglycan recycling